MHEWRGAVLSAAAALAACSPSPEEEASPSPGAVAAEETAEADVAQAEPSNTLPPSDAAYRYVGRWAEGAEQCRSEVWTLTRDRLTAPDDIACEFTQVEESPGGYAIDATCTIDGKPEDDNIVLRFAESAEAMLVEGATTLPETGLVYCGETG